MNFDSFKSSFLIILREIGRISSDNEESIEKKLIIVFERMNGSRGKKNLNKINNGFDKEDYLTDFRNHFK